MGCHPGSHLGLLGHLLCVMWYVTWGVTWGVTLAATLACPITCVRFTASKPSIWRVTSRVVCLDHLCAIRCQQALHLAIQPGPQPPRRLSPRRHRHQVVAPHHPGVKLPIRPTNPRRSGGSTRGGRGARCSRNCRRRSVGRGGGGVAGSRRNRRIRCRGADRGNRVCVCV